jgi:hypothetical protein
VCANAGTLTFTLILSCWKLRAMHHDACTHVRVLGHQNNMRDIKGDKLRDNKRGQVA